MFQIRRSWQSVSLSILEPSSLSSHPSLRQARCLSLTSTVFHSDQKDVQEGDGCGKAAAAVKPKRGKTPIGKLDELEEGHHPFQEKDPLKPHPGGVNPGSNEH